MMVSTPLISPGNRKLIGFNKPVLRIYKHNSAGMILINKAGVRHANLSAGDYINIYHTSHGIALGKKYAFFNEDGFELKLDDRGRVRVYISRMELKVLMAYFGCKNNSLALFIEDRFELSGAKMMYCHKLKEAVVK